MTKRRERTAIDAELRSLKSIAAMLDAADPKTQLRMLHWAWARFVEDPARQVDAMASGLRALRSAPKAGRR